MKNKISLHISFFELINSNNFSLCALLLLYMSLLIDEKRFTSFLIHTEIEAERKKYPTTILSRKKIFIFNQCVFSYIH